MRALKNADIAQEPCDALIYSTNVQLNCTGGVGGALMARYGKALQEELHGLLKRSGRRFVPQGELFDLVIPGMPYRHLIHTIPCDGFYDTSPEIVEDILRRALDICAADANVKRVAVSALGTGYGHLKLEDFLRIANQAFQAPRAALLEDIVICIEGVETFDRAVFFTKKDSLNFEIII